MPRSSEMVNSSAQNAVASGEYSSLARTTCTEGLLKGSQRLTIVAESDLVVFGDGMESDTLSLGWGERLDLRTADTRLNLVR
jgi:hypothetical protein